MPSTTMLITLINFVLLAPIATGTLPMKRNVISDCLTHAKVPQNYPGSPSFAQAIIPYNLRLPFTPIAVAVPSTVSQVQAAVACGVKYNVTVSARSGGHSYASDGLGGEDGHLMIDMKLFHKVEVDESTNIATIEPGARLGNIALQLYTQYERAISHGTCPGVGIGGHALHGGFGLSSHTHGLTLDAMIEAKVVLANSSFITASTTQNHDIFWAIRGAGSSFGIVTSFKFQTFPAPSSNIVFNYTFAYNGSDAPLQAFNAFSVLQEYVNTTMSKEMNMRLLLSLALTSISGVYYGTLEGFEGEIGPLLIELRTPATESVQVLGWIETLEANADGNLETGLDYNAHDTFFAKSLFTTTTGVSLAAMESFIGYIFTIAIYVPRDWFLIVDLQGGPTSEIANIPTDATSYAHRDALFMYQFYDRVTTGSYPSDGFSFLDGWVDTITSTMNDSVFGMYYNYADPTLSAGQAHTAYWLENYEKLAAIKEKVDPWRVFSNPQAVLST